MINPYEFGPILTPWDTIPDSIGFKSTASWGAIGDYFAGVYGTIFSTILSLLTITFVAAEYLRGKREAKHNRYLTHYYHLFDQLSETAKPLRVRDDQSKKDVFSKFISEFRIAYILASSFPQSLRINAAYIFTFFGPTLTANNLLISQKYKRNDVENYGNAISALRNKDGIFNGYLGQLGNYQRCLFSAYRHIQKSPFRKSEKYDFGKIIRTQMTTNEQALLVINALSSLGNEWIAKNTINEFQIIKNLPKTYFEWDKEKIDLETLFPAISFEYEDYLDLSEYSIPKNP